MNYKFDSIVNKQEAEALKDMIFKRVRERSQAMTDDVQADVMSLARESFVKSNNNPFAQFIDGEENSKPAQTPAAKTTESTGTHDMPDGIGFPQRELKARAQEQERMVKDEISTIALRSTMNEARESLSNKRNFLEALNFLNTQGSVSLMRTRSDRFEVMG